MELHVINSNSAGNCYVLRNNQESLIIECGVRFDLIKQALKFNLKSVVGCLVSHEHGDHAKAIHEVQKAGINVYASFGTHRACKTLDGAGNHRSIVLKSGEKVKIGGFTVLPFDTKHDAAEPLGFLIRHAETGLVLFLTDSYFSEYAFPGLNNVIVEANYCQQILDDRLRAGENPRFLRDRVITSHMSLETCKGLLRANDLSQVNNIVLIHLSDSNSHAERFKREVEEATGKVVHIATAKLTIPFNKNPF